MSVSILPQPASNFQSKIDLFLQDCHAKKLVHYPHGEDYTPPDLAENPEQFAKFYVWDVHLGYITDILREFQQEVGPGFCNCLNEIQKIVDYENSIPNKWEYTLTIGDAIEDIEDSIIDDLTPIDGEPYALEDMERKILDLELAGERINDHYETYSANELLHRVWLIDANELKCRQRAIGEKIDKMREKSRRGGVEARREYYANPNNFFKGKTFIPKRMADFLMWQYELRYAGSQLWVYRDGVYLPEGADLVKKETQRYLKEYTTTNRVNESANYIERETLTAMPGCNDHSEIIPQHINLVNGRLNWETLELGKHYPVYFEISQLPVAYDPDAKDPIFERYLKTSVGDRDTILMLEEFLGYCLLPYTRLEKMLTLTGEGSNGKSVFIDVVSWLIGAENRSSIVWHDLEENRFAVANLVGKLVNLCGDVDSRAMRYSNSMKRLVTGDTVTAERKNQHSFEFRNYAKFIFSTNDLPPSNDKTKGFYRRLLIVPFTHEFVDKNPDNGQFLKDRELRSKLRRELPGILNRALRGLRRLMLHNHQTFTDSEAAKNALFLYQCDNDSVMAFAVDQLRETPGATIVKKELYKEYIAWCEIKGLKPEPHNRGYAQSIKSACRWIGEGRLHNGEYIWKNVARR